VTTGGVDPVATGRERDAYAQSEDEQRD